ncbi:MAG TPA: 3-phosphoserine/phosphohydroxythreonine transaminase [Balneolaceae bacterium]|nr:3-phosphoserine/phosphohydroxythreonine transaminase [Balneolaceae bacterium]
MSRVHNFSPGPAQLPLEVLKKAKSELTNYQDIGYSVMEMSHRSAAYTEIDRQAKSRIRDLLNLGDDFHIMFLQGGASSQFMMVPYNFLPSSGTADYIDTGRWSSKAIKEAKLFGNVHVPFSSSDGGYDRVPSQDELSFSEDPAYVHFTSNNTVAGTQFKTEPKTDGVPLVCDASSDFLARPIDVDRYGVIYAGAQKNVGPAGVTIVIVNKEFLEQQGNTDNTPTILQYQTHTERIFNTPPAFNVYMVNLVLEWIEDQGGLSHFAELNKKKAKLLYDEIDRDDFYKGAVQKDSRSLMNVTYRLPSEELEQKFLDEAADNDLVSLKGHRSVGGIRASLYNACSMESVEKLVDFMKDFRDKNG